jgi:hypothetical protein
MFSVACSALRVQRCMFNIACPALLSQHCLFNTLLLPETLFGDVFWGGGWRGETREVLRFLLGFVWRCPGQLEDSSPSPGNPFTGVAPEFSGINIVAHVFSFPPCHACPPPPPLQRCLATSLGKGACWW